MRKIVFTVFLSALCSFTIWAQKAPTSVRITTKVTPRPTVEEDLASLEKRMVDTVGAAPEVRQKYETAYHQLKERKAKIDAERAAIAARKEEQNEEAEQAPHVKKSQNETPGKQ